MSAPPLTTIDRVFRLGKHRLRVRVDSPQDSTAARPPLLLCNGYGLPLDALDTIAARFARYTTVIRFDVPGIGGSPMTALPYRFATLASVLDELLQRLGHEQVDIFGMSWGGMLAQQFALDYPGRCRRVVLAATMSGIVSVPGNLALHALRNPSLWWQPPKISRMASLLYGGRVSKTDWRRLERNLALYAPDLPGYWWQMICIFWWTTAHRLRRMQQPTLLLFGRHDPVAPVANGYFLNFLIPNSKLVRLDCGHLFPWTQLDRVQGELDAFLA